MIPAALLALALLAQDATPASQAEPAPTETPAAAAPVTPIEGPVPPGAPEDDYGLVSWCHGALSGHMALYPAVKPTLDALSTDPTRSAFDADQMAAGQTYLALYEGAITSAETANQRIRPRGEQARAKGANIWAPATNAVDPNTRMWSWLMWELPGRCETAALRLTERSALLAPATAAEETAPVETAADEPAPTESENPPTP